MSTLKGRVLVVDDQIVWLELFSELLAELGLEVDTTDNYVEAVQLLSDRYYHLALIDVRLKDDDPGNRQGMDLLTHIDEAGLTNVVTKIVITGYGTRDWARESFKTHHVHDFIPKQGPDGKGFDEKDFTSSIIEAFKERIGINLDLEMRFVHGLSLEEMVSLVVPGSLAEEQVAACRWELEDLLRKLFVDAESITIARMPQGRSGAAVVRVEPFYEGRGQAEPVIVKFGTQIDEIEREIENYSDYVSGFVGGGRHTDLKRHSRTRSFGGIAYSLVGATMPKVRSYGQFYAANDTLRICAILDDLFDQTCRKWYENRQLPITSNLAELYWRDVDKRYAQILASFKANYAEYAVHREISFPELPGVFVNPVYHPYATGQPINLQVHMPVTHGDLNAQNILVDEELHTWIIDFAKTGVRHVLADFVTMESVVKFQLLNTDSPALLFEFEKAVLAPTSFSQTIMAPSVVLTADIAKAFSIINHLRKLAGNVILPSRDISTYYAGLLYHTLNLLRYPFITQSQRQRFHVILSSALLCARLQELLP